MLDHDERIAADLNDRVIGHLFGCGLSLASVLDVAMKALEQSGSSAGAHYAIGPSRTERRGGERPLTRVPESRDRGIP